MKKSWYSKTIPKPPYGAWITDNLPEGKDGFVTQDVDLIVRNTKTDEIMFLEFKEGIHDMDYAQRKTFGVTDRGLKRGIPDKYMGHYLVLWNKKSIEQDSVMINLQYDLTLREYKQFLLGKLVLKPYSFKIRR